MILKARRIIKYRNQICAIEDGPNDSCLDNILPILVDVFQDLSCFRSDFGFDWLIEVHSDLFRLEGCKSE